MVEISSTIRYSAEDEVGSGVRYGATTSPEGFRGNTMVYLRKFGLPERAESDKSSRPLSMSRLLPVCLSLAVFVVPKAFGDEQSTSPYATAADFAKYAMKLREQALLKVEPQVFIPTSSRPAIQRYPWKTNIVTTVFWVGEQAAGNNPVPNYRSSWDANWTNNYGGFDVSPAVRDYLGLAPTDVTDWQFIEVRDVPPGPWRSYGENNNFVIARGKTEQRMADRNVSAAKK